MRDGSLPYRQLRNTTGDYENETFSFTAVQAAQKLWGRTAVCHGEFTAVQAAQKDFVPVIVNHKTFTAVQAAQKIHKRFGFI